MLAGNKKDLEDQREVKNNNLVLLNFRFDFFVIKSHLSCSSITGVFEVIEV